MGRTATIEHDCEADDGYRWVSLRTIADAQASITAVLQVLSGPPGSISMTQASWSDTLAFAVSCDSGMWFALAYVTHDELARRATVRPCGAESSAAIPDVRSSANTAGQVARTGSWQAGYPAASTTWARQARRRPVTGSKTARGPEASAVVPSSRSLLPLGGKGGGYVPGNVGFAGRSLIE